MFYSGFNIPLGLALAIIGAENLHLIAVYDEDDACYWIAPRVFAGFVDGMKLNVKDGYGLKAMRSMLIQYRDGNVKPEIITCQDWIRPDWLWLSGWLSRKIREISTLVEAA